MRIAWSYKTNYLGAICKVFHQEGSLAEVVSGMELKKALARAHILEGLKIALDWLDAVIELIRASKTPPEAKQGLMEGRFADPEFGEWFGYLNRDGSRVWAAKANGWKGCFHLPRVLFRCYGLLKDFAP